MKVATSPSEADLAKMYLSYILIFKQLKNK